VFGHEWVLWVLATASAMHVVEEHTLGWQGWAAEALGSRFGVRPTWTDFWATNGFLIVLAISAAVVGWRAPAFALAYPAGMLIDTAGFHILPSLSARRPNPGLFTGVGLYLPISIWCYAAADQDGVLDAATLIGSVAIGAGLMAFVIGVLALGNRFGYPDSA
jgi:hypothetical protein